MKAVLLGRKSRLLTGCLPDWDVTYIDRRLGTGELKFIKPDWVVSFGYRHILPGPVLNEVGGRAINLHISLLPWCRGADPNLWSWLEDSPKGVTIHWMSPELDRGEIVAQRPVDLNPTHTLHQTYNSLTDEIAQLFAGIVPDMSKGTLPRSPQLAGGSYHRSSDKDAHWLSFPLGWETPCHIVRAYGEEHGLNVRT